MKPHVLLAPMLALALAIPASAQPLGSTIVYRLYRPLTGDHFYTTSSVEREAAMQRQGYIDEGVIGWVFPRQEDGVTALYRLYSARTDDHFYTTSVAERDQAMVTDYTLDGVMGYVWVSEQTSSRPLFRLYNRQSGDHMYTTSDDERSNAIQTRGYVSEGITSYISTDGL